jgi:hypothetical protein
VKNFKEIQPNAYYQIWVEGIVVNQKYAAVLIFVLLLPSVYYLNPISSDSAVKNGIKAWTVMLYFCGDTRNSEVVGIDNSGNSIDLYLSFVKSHLKDDLATGSDAQLNVILLYDYPYSPAHPSGQAILYHITPGTQTQVAQWGATNMGDEATLSQFVGYCKTNYPANNYALFLSDHGRGYAGICYDYHAPHPYGAYALGDCLELPEIRGALSGGNEVDVLFLDCCLGSSFELAWEVASVAEYMVASETVGPTEVVYHPRDVLYALSRNTSMTPRYLAKTGYQVAINPVLVPSGFDGFPSAVLIDLDRFSTGFPSFSATFNDFTWQLIDEFNHNTSIRNLIIEVRNNCTTYGLDSASSMMVDLVDFLEQVVAFGNEFYYNETSTLATSLISWLTPGENNIVIDEYYWYPDFTHLHGLSLCLPDSGDMYKGFLWPNMYQNLKICQDTQWGAFVDDIFPTYSYDNFRIPECYHIFVHPLDPVTQLHIFLEDPLRQVTYHVGLNRAFADQPGMGIEVGIAGAEYHQDLLWGNAMIRIPATSLQHIASSKQNGVAAFKIFVNTSATTLGLKTVNVTVKHINQGTVVWEQNQVAVVLPGAVVSCLVFTNDTMTAFDVKNPPISPIPPLTTIAIVITAVVLFLIITLVVYRKRRKKPKKR